MTHITKNDRRHFTTAYATVDDANMMPKLLAMRNDTVRAYVDAGHYHLTLEEFAADNHRFY